MKKIWVKVCGMTRLIDANAAANLGVDALGFVFVPNSSRALLLEACSWINEVDERAQRVGLFMDAPGSLIERVLEATNLDLLQFHGKETPAECIRWGMPYIKALGLADELDQQAWLDRAHQYDSAEALLIDSHGSGQMGGTGQVGDWSKLRKWSEGLQRPWILAGGLNPENVRSALEQLSPMGIDLSSGVESQPGIKDHGKIERLMAQCSAIENEAHWSL